MVRAREDRNVRSNADVSAQDKRMQSMAVIKIVDGLIICMSQCLFFIYPGCSANGGLIVAR